MSQFYFKHLSCNQVGAIGINVLIYNINIMNEHVLLLKMMTTISWVMIMVLNATFNNISVISCQSLWFVAETKIPEENHQHAANHWQPFMAYSCIQFTSLWSTRKKKPLTSCKSLKKTIMAYRCIQYTSPRSTRRKPPTCCKSLTNFYGIELYPVHISTEYPEKTIDPPQVT